MPNKLQLSFFYILTLAVAAIAFFIFLPYFKVLFLAIFFAVIFYPMHRHIMKTFGSGNMAALISVAIIILLILLPLIGLGFLMIQEAQGTYTYLSSPEGQIKLMNTAGQIQSIVDRFVPGQWVPAATIEGLETYMNQFYGWIADHFQGFFSGAFKLLADLFILVFALFFFLRDGQKFRDVLITLSPLSDRYDQNILDKMENSVNSVIKGSLFIAIAQGVLSGIGFLVFGVPAPVLWGSVATVAALVPSVGTALIIIPAAIFLFATVGTWQAVGLLIWGLIIVGLVDNVLRPVLLERGIKVHPFLILVSVVGGIGLFGPLGFLLGPIVLSLLFALIELYPQVTGSIARSSSESMPDPVQK